MSKWWTTAGGKKLDVVELPENVVGDGAAEPGVSDGERDRFVDIGRGGEQRQGHKTAHGRQPYL